MLRKGPKIRAVKAVCAADREATVSPLYETVKIPPSHPVLESETAIIPISEVRILTLAHTRTTCLSNHII